MPVSCVMGNNSTIGLIKAGEHGSTFGGNSLGMAVAKTAVEVLVEEGMVENSKKMGDLLLGELQSIKSGLIKEVRGRGLFISIELNPLSKKQRVTGMDLSLSLLNNKLLAKPTH